MPYDPVEVAEDVVAALKIYGKIKDLLKTFPPGPATGAEIGQVLAAVAPDIGVLYDKVKSQGQS